LKEFYYELRITPSIHYDLYLDLLLSISNDALEELQNSIIIRSEEPLDAIRDGIEYFTIQLQQSIDKKITCEILQDKLKNEDWISKYQNSIKPIEIGKFYIHTSWQEERLDKINILINPALAFGSGHHDTTSTCLEAIAKYVKKNNSFIDVGTGSGILAIAASKIGAIVDICDTHEVSIDNANENFAFNKTTYNNAWIGSALNTSNTYDVVVANIVADVLIMIKNDLNKILKNGGKLILSGILDKYEQKVLKKYKEFKIKEKIKSNEWITLILIKDTNG
jgi:ribosomal protein L11 methyltransferase